MLPVLMPMLQVRSMRMLMNAFRMRVFMRMPTRRRRRVDVVVMLVVVPVCVVMFQGFMAMAVNMVLDESKPRPPQHEEDCNRKIPRRQFTPYQHGQKYAHEWSRRIIGASPGRAEETLRLDVEENAEAVGHEAEEQGLDDSDARARKWIPRQRRDRKRGQTRAEAFDDDDCRRGLGRDVPGAVIFHSPATAGGDDKQRTT